MFKLLLGAAIGYYIARKITPSEKEKDVMVKIETFIKDKINLCMAVFKKN